MMQVHNMLHAFMLGFIFAECPETCTYQDFVYIMKPVVFTGSFMDWQAECQDVPQKIPSEQGIFYMRYTVSFCSHEFEFLVHCSLGQHTHRDGCSSCSCYRHRVHTPQTSL